MIGSLLVTVSMALAPVAKPAPPKAPPPAALKLLETKRPTPAQRVLPGLR